MRVAALGVAALILYLVLLQPNHPAAMTWGAFKMFPLEFPVLLCALIALGPGAPGRWIRAALALVLSVIVVLKCADLVSFNALSRGFNPVSDLALIDAFVRLLVGAVGPILAGLVVLAALLVILALPVLLWWAMAQWAELSVPHARLFWLPAGLAAVVAVAEIGQAMRAWTLPLSPPGAAFTARVGVERITLARRTLDELATFQTRAAQDPFAQATGLFDRIDRDVLLIYIESYGRASLDTPLYAETHAATLNSAAVRLQALGLTTASGFLNAPTRGGQSWLSHGTVSNGLWIDNQISYRAALASGRQTLFHHAARAGLHTAAVMPQITMDWPESALMGFETVLVSSDLGYRGLPFNWVTMPDQFTLTALDRLLRRDATPRHLFAQVVLSSSHAPWVPVPDLLPWSAIGDGTEFNAMAAAGDPPDVVWRDRDRIRDQYRQAVDYSLQVVFDYAALHAADPPLILVIGDHQAAEFVALDDRPDVPIHVIGHAPLVAALSHIAPTPGLIPGPEIPVLPMDQVRDRLLSSLSSTPPSALTPSPPALTQ